MELLMPHSNNKHKRILLLNPISIIQISPVSQSFPIEDRHYACLCLASKVVRLVRAKQATKPKTSLDTLIEVVQKELLRVNGEPHSISLPSLSICFQTKQ